MAKPVTPDSEEALGEIVKSAREKGESLHIVGGGTRQALGNPVTAKCEVATTALSGITLYEPGALTLVAQAGTPLEEINELLASENQHLAFEPADYRNLLGSNGTPTIGGLVAAGISGPRRIQAGACRDSLIGVRFVDGQGETVKNGGRVMKNVTGYDLVKLMCGSYGTLGILTEVSFKLLPKPETSALVMVSSLGDPDAISALSVALSSPYDVSGACHMQRGPEGKALTLVRLEGFEGSVNHRSGKLKELLAGFGEVAISLDHKKNCELIDMVRDVTPFADKPGAVWRLSVKPSDGPKVVLALQQRMPLEVIYDWGGGLIWLLVDEENDASAAVIRAAVNHVGGHATLIRASDETKASAGAFHPQAPVNARLSEAIRQKFDPAGILNPGLMTNRDREAAL